MSPSRLRRYLLYSSGADALATKRGLTYRICAYHPTAVAAQQFIEKVVIWIQSPVAQQGGENKYYTAVTPKARCTVRVPAFVCSFTTAVASVRMGFGRKSVMSVPG